MSLTLSDIDSASELDENFDRKLRLSPSESSENSSITVPPRKKTFRGSENSEENACTASKHFTVTETSLSVPKITFFPRNSNVILPKKATPGSAGFDIFMSRRTKLKVGMNKVKLKFGVQLPRNSVGLIRERSSGAMRNIVTHAGVIDYDFPSSNDLCILLENKNDRRVYLKRGVSVAQLLLMPLLLAEVKIKKDENYKNTKGKGGKNSLTRGFGSTGNAPQISQFDDTDQDSFTQDELSASTSIVRRPQNPRPQTPGAAMALTAPMLTHSIGGARKRCHRTLQGEETETEQRKPVRERLGWDKVHKNSSRKHDERRRTK